MGQQLKLFKVAPLISQELKDLLHGQESFQLALQLAQSQRVNKLALFIECIKRHFKDYMNLEWWLDDRGYANKRIFDFDFYGIYVIVCEVESESFWLGLYDHKDMGAEAFVELKFDEWKDESETWADKDDLPTKCVREIYKNSFQFTNILKRIY